MKLKKLDFDANEVLPANGHTLTPEELDLQSKIRELIAEDFRGEHKAKRTKFFWRSVDIALVTFIVNLFAKSIADTWGHDTSTDLVYNEAKKGTDYEYSVIEGSPLHDSLSKQLAIYGLSALRFLAGPLMAYRKIRPIIKNADSVTEKQEEILKSHPNKVSFNNHALQKVQDLEKMPFIW